ncbi:MAG: AAA family ATPase [Nocardioides sp.]
MVLEITLLGSPRVLRGGQPVVFETRKATALLAHLAMSDRPRSRGTLCELLYPGHDPERARGALRRTLSALRKGVGEEWIETTGDAIALKRHDGFRLDIELFRDAASERSSASRLRDAANLFPGDFLEGFSLRDSPEFDDWQTATADALRAELAGVLRRLVGVLSARGELEEALRCAARWLSLDPLHEPAHRELIRLHAWSGDRAAALEQYRACVRTLSHELGVAPLEETTTLYAQVNDGSLARRETPVPVPLEVLRVAPPGELPLIGRDEEVAALIAAHEACRVDGGLVVVEGEAGIGKTRIVDELLTRARSNSAVVLQARCHDDEAGLPYGPLVELLRAAAIDGPRWCPSIARQRLADAARLLPELADLVVEGPALLPLEGPGAQVRLVEGVAAVLGAACAGPRPGVVFLDDVHAADEATLDAIAYVGRRLRGRPLLLVLTWRTERVPPGHLLRRLVSDVGRDGPTASITPGRLGVEDVATLVRSGAPSASPELVRRVHDESEGLPLFVSEYLVGLSGDVDAPQGHQQQVGGMFDARLAGLGDVARQVLGAAATIGRSFDSEILRRASGRSADETVDALEELVAHGLVREGEDASYDFCHQKLREHVYERTALARRRLLHGRVAAAMVGSRRGVDRAALVAQHLRLAGELDGAAEQYVIAAEHAASLFAHADAVEHLEAALALGHPDVSALHERTGDLRTTMGDYAGALAGYQTAAAYCATSEDRAPIEHKLGNVHQRRGEWDMAEMHLRSALDAANDGQVGLRARVHADLGLTLLQAGDAAGAATLAHEALALAESASDSRAEAQAHNMLGVLARSDGAPQLALVHLERSLEIARRLDDWPAQTAALNNLALLRKDAGDLTGALGLTEVALALCSNYGDRHREAALENNLADLHHAAGHKGESMAHLKRAVTLFREVGADDAARLPEIWKLVSW